MFLYWFCNLDIKSGKAIFSFWSSSRFCKAFCTSIQILHKSHVWILVWIPWRLSLNEESLFHTPGVDSTIFSTDRDGFSHPWWKVKPKKLTFIVWIIFQQLKHVKHVVKCMFPLPRPYVWSNKWYQSMACFILLKNWRFCGWKNEVFAFCTVAPRRLKNTLRRSSNWKTRRGGTAKFFLDFNYKILENN